MLLCTTRPGQSPRGHSPLGTGCQTAKWKESLHLEKQDSKDEGRQLQQPKGYSELGGTGPRLLEGTDPKVEGSGRKPDLIQGNLSPTGAVWHKGHGPGLQGYGLPGQVRPADLIPTPSPEFWCCQAPPAEPPHLLTLRPSQTDGCYIWPELLCNSNLNIRHSEPSVLRYF